MAALRYGAAPFIQPEICKANAKAPLSVCFRLPNCTIVFRLSGNETQSATRNPGTAALCLRLGCVKQSV